VTKEKLSTSKLLLTFGLKNNTLVHISDVPRGDACNCICPHCKASLRANHGSLKQYYFSHQRGFGCSSAIETALHQAAKQVFIENSYIILPPIKAEALEQDINGKWYQESQHILRDYKQFTINNVQIEVRQENIKPDIIISIDGHDLLVEIAVTHFIDDKKLKKINSQGISTIEIDLSKMSANANWKEIKTAVLDGQNSQWVYNSKQLSTLDKLQHSLKLKVNNINQEITAQKQEKHKAQTQEDTNAASDYLNFLIQQKRINNHHQIKGELEVYALQAPSFLIQHINFDTIYGCHGGVWQHAVFLRFIKHKKGFIYGRKVKFEQQIATYLQNLGFSFNKNIHQTYFSDEKAISFFIQELIDSHILIRCGRFLYKVISE